MLNIFPYIFSTTFNVISSNIDLIDSIVDNVVNNIVNSEVVDNLICNIDNIASTSINFKEHKRGYTIDCYLPGIKKDDINLEYDNNYITIKVKRSMFYSNNKNIVVTILQDYGDIEEDYYVENVDPYNIKAVFKNDILKVLIPKNTYIGKDTTIIDVESYEN